MTHGLRVGRSEAAGADDTGLAALGDQALLGLARAGNTAAFAELYDRHRAAARRLARRLVRGRVEADDVVAETFTRVLRALRHGGGALGLVVTDQSVPGGLVAGGGADGGGRHATGHRQRGRCRLGRPPDRRPGRWASAAHRTHRRPRHRRRLAAGQSGDYHPSWHRYRRQQFVHAGRRARRAAGIGIRRADRIGPRHAAGGRDRRIGHRDIDHRPDRRRHVQHGYQPAGRRHADQLAAGRRHTYRADRLGHPHAEPAGLRPVEPQP